MIKLSGVSVFQWSTNEQVYPFEKDKLGRDLYCKIISFTGMQTKAHGIDASKLFKVWGTYTDLGGPGYIRPLPYVEPTDGYFNNSVAIDLKISNIILYSGASHPGTTDVYLIYAK